MRKTLLALIISAGLSSPVYAIEVVIDPAAIVQATLGVGKQAASLAADAKAYGADVLSWAKQVKDMEDQYTKMTEQYNSMTGSRNLGEIFNDEGLKDYLPDDWQEAYEASRTGGFEALSGIAKDIYEDNAIFDTCRPENEDLLTEEASEEAEAKELSRMLCQANASKTAMDKSYTVTALNATKNRMTQIDQLMAQINNTPDPKAIAELQARIGIEQANLQNEQMKLKLFEMTSQQDEKLLHQSQKEAAAKVRSYGYTSILPEPSNLLASEDE